MTQSSKRVRGWGPLGMMARKRLQVLHNRAPMLVRMLLLLARKVRKAYTVARQIHRINNLPPIKMGFWAHRAATPPG